MEQENINPHKQMITYYRKNPDKWVEECLGCKLHKYQKILLKLYLFKYKVMGG